MNLSIDIGNTAVKIAVFDQGKIVHQATHEFISPDVLEQLGKSYPLKKCILSSVRKPNSALVADLAEMYELLLLGDDTPLPFEILYETPKTLGKDRIAAVAGAISMHADCDLLVIDAGTCLTIDYYDKAKGYMGGRISPGIDMRFRSLNQYTDLLPLENWGGEDYLRQDIGPNTLGSIRSGVLEGIMSEVEQAIQKFKAGHANAKVLLTGGNHSFFASYLENEIFAVPELVLIGLNAILEHNAQPKS